MNSHSRRILLTGATRGLGRALFEGFALTGHELLACGRNIDTAVRWSDSLPDTARLEKVDVSVDDDVADWAERARARGWTPDLIINNAALINQPAPLWKCPATEFDAILAVNLGGIANVVRHFVPGMIANGRGVIVNMSSGWGRSVSADVAPYCATKWAVEGLSQALASDLPSGFAAIALNPGIIDTDMLRKSFGASASQYESPKAWAERAIPFLLELGSRDNGSSLSIP